MIKIEFEINEGQGTLMAHWIIEYCVDQSTTTDFTSIHYIVLSGKQGHAKLFSGHCVISYK